ncbi:MAG: molybdopterin-binding protein [Pseudomonadota bacterium]
MKFGAVKLAQAEGAILAHSVPVSGRRLRKGSLLTREDIAALAATGAKEVIVAQLASNDVGEDRAADLLGRAIAGSDPGIEVTRAFTGRVNLLAKQSGVVDLGVPALHAVNAVDPMITVATVPPWQQMTVGGMIATVKIISYAVHQERLDHAIAAAGTRSVRLRPPALKAATLIVTEIANGPGEKGKEAIAARLAALNVDLARVVTVTHDLPALAAALRTTATDLVLILTASATSDIEDVAPAAVRAAGGEVDRFGMPVDPGNLLFLGRIGARHVIGLPGCARSPALNGADWVLSRVICGVPPTAGDIGAMGVGGLLKEIPSRPQPRQRRR